MVVNIIELEEILLEGEILNTYCDCPYDWSDYCKHQAAALFALRSKKNNNASRPKQEKTNIRQEKKSDLKSIVSNLQKKRNLSK